MHLYLERDGKVLLGLRHPDSAYAPSTYHFLAGPCEQESAVAFLIREAQEEAGLVIEPGDVEFAHAIHLIDAPGTQPRRWSSAPGGGGASRNSWSRTRASAGTGGH
ncbi:MULTISPECIES: hypothetical protein [Streptomyces]|uniref:hypothetical protein n=1 Tax=Streptomyces TaxID=1883 RepID=UPI001FCB97AF|nr:hypothetical protein [Streptomyces melanosporofaciens]